MGCSRSKPAFDDPSPAERKGNLLSILSADPDKAHDKKCAGLSGIPPSITELKVSLRRLRDVAEGTAKFYQKYADEASHASSSKRHASWVLSLPELGEWSCHAAFCGSSEASDELLHEVSHCAAIAGLAKDVRGVVGGPVCASLRDAARCAAAGLGLVQAFELRVKDATTRQETAAKALRRAHGAREAAAADGRKAEVVKEAKKREAASAAAQKALAKADFEIGEAQAAAAVAAGDLSALAGSGVEEAVAAGRAAQREAELKHVHAACAALARAYDAFSRRTLDVQSGKLGILYEPDAGKPTDYKEKPFAAYKAQWQMAQQKLDASARQLGEWRRAGLEATLAPREEGARLAALAGVCIDPETAKAAACVSLPPEAQQAAKAACDAAAVALETALGGLAARLRVGVAAVSEFRKQDGHARKVAEALEAIEAKAEECEREVARLAEAGKSTERKDGELSKLKSEREAQRGELARHRAAVECAESEIEKKAEGFRSGEASVSRRLVEPLRGFVSSYFAFCACRHAYQLARAPPAQPPPPSHSPPPPPPAPLPAASPAASLAASPAASPPLPAASASTSAAAQPSYQTNYVEVMEAKTPVETAAVELVFGVHDASTDKGAAWLAKEVSAVASATAAAPSPVAAPATAAAPSTSTAPVALSATWLPLAAGSPPVAAVAVYDFIAPPVAAADERGGVGRQLSLLAGDRVLVDSVAGDGWLFGRSPGGQSGFFPASHVERDEVDDSDRFTSLSAGSFTTVALSAVPSAVLKAGAIGASLRPAFGQSLGQSLGQSGALGYPRTVEEVDTLGPDDSISNAGQRSPHSMATPPQLPWVRLVADQGGRTDTEEGGVGSSAGVKIAQPDSVAALLGHATRKAALLWPDRPATVATALLDEDGCEVDEDNFCLVQPGAVLYVQGAAVRDAIASSPPPASPTPSSPNAVPPRVASGAYIG